MGYSFIIGERLAARDPAEIDSAVGQEHPDAPAYGEPTDRTNARWPSYGGWAQFLEEVGLTYLFPSTGGYARDPECPPLMVEHPGVMPVLPLHLTRIHAALEAFRDKIGRDKLPGWGPGEESEQGPDSAYNGNLARLVWLQYWIEWALRECKDPVCANT